MQLPLSGDIDGDGKIQETCLELPIEDSETLCDEVGATGWSRLCLSQRLCGQEDAT